MLVLLLAGCASVAGAEPYGADNDWGDLAQRIQQLDEEGELIDTQPILTPPDEVIEPEEPIQVETPDEEPPVTEE